MTWGSGFGHSPYVEIGFDVKHQHLNDYLAFNIWQKGRFVGDCVCAYCCLSKGKLISFFRCFYRD